MLDHPKIVRLSDAALALHLRGMLHCAKYLTDGLVARTMVPRLGTRAALRELARAQLWQAAKGGGWLIHDYLEYNPSRVQVEATRVEYHDRARKGAAARWGTDDASKHASKHENDACKHAPLSMLRDPLVPGTPSKREHGAPDLATAKAAFIRVGEMLAHFTPPPPPPRRPRR
jgi:hypothetical protein